MPPFKHIQTVPILCLDISRLLYFSAGCDYEVGRIGLPSAIVLMNAEVGFETEVLKEVKKVEGVDDAWAVYGVYDIVARLRADTMDELKEMLTFGIRKIDKVKSTLSMIIVEEKVET